MPLNELKCKFSRMNFTLRSLKYYPVFSLVVHALKLVLIETLFIFKFVC